MSNLLHDVTGMRRRADADRPSPAIPLVLLGMVVAGALVVAVMRAPQGDAATNIPGGMVLVENVPGSDPVRLLWWVFASLAAYLAAIWIARRQGYRRGIWVDRLPLALGGLSALLVAIIVWPSGFAPGDLFIRGNVPLLAIAAGIVVWTVRERRFGLWLLTVVIVPLALLVNLYDLENVLFRFGMPDFAGADEAIGLGAVAVALFVAAALFAAERRREAVAHRSAS